MLIGQKELIIDDKGRLVLPSLYRDDFKGGLSYCGLGLDGCLVLYPTETYQKEANKYMSLDDFDSQARSVKRTFLSNTFEVPIDSHNRILVPKPLLEKTKTGRKVTAVGIGDHLEIWDSAVFNSMSASKEESYSADAAKLIGTKKA
ncbi:MAG: division/cell wall cluster transcriptional repressor MraZ [Bacilli bacterium]|jgi:MraZ protein|nr:division/cell wall cluster transcriptional repressor MraZ [Bacilli bacterium]